MRFDVFSFGMLHSNVYIFCPVVLILHKKSLWWTYWKFYYIQIKIISIRFQLWLASRILLCLINNQSSCHRIKFKVTFWSPCTAPKYCFSSINLQLTHDWYHLRNDGGRNKFLFIKVTPSPNKIFVYKINCTENVTFRIIPYIPNACGIYTKYRNISSILVIQIQIYMHKHYCGLICICF